MKNLGSEKILKVVKSKVMHKEMAEIYDATVNKFVWTALLEYLNTDFFFIIVNYDSGSLWGS